MALLSIQLVLAIGCFAPPPPLRPISPPRPKNTPTKDDSLDPNPKPGASTNIVRSIVNKCQVSTSSAVFVTKCQQWWAPLTHCSALCRGRLQGPSDASLALSLIT